jgi:Dyp-type peroxidase family
VRPQRVKRRQRVDQADLQGNILAGYPFKHAVFMFLHIDDPAEGRAWLGRVVDRVTTAVPWAERPAHTLNVALTFDGLRALRIPERTLKTFPEEFRQGMAQRAERLGDIGPNAPVRWEAGLRPGEPHALLTAYAVDENVLGALREQLRSEAQAAGLHVLHEVKTDVIERGPKPVVFEHFGFADGLAQPEIDARAKHADHLVGPYPGDGRGRPTRRGWKGLQPGEFVLGYADEAGLTADKPAAPLARSGSYMVVRKLQQNVALFHRYFLEAAGGDEKRARLLEAKVVGRWPDGTPLVKQPDAPPERSGNERPENDFKYKDDPDGHHCPIGSHIRRTNPRDSIGFRGRLTSRHRIIRRGMPYGPAVKNRYVDDGLDRGLMFVCYQASLARQFELIQGRWIMDGDAFGLGAEQDFLLGLDDPRGTLTIEGEPPEFLGPQRTFVINRGGAYFFAPGIAALKALANQLV